MIKVIKRIAIWIWCFPQMIAGLLLRVITKATKDGDHYKWNIESGSLSMGTYVFLCPSHYEDERVLLHEKGHVKQSYILGWLYLLVIGVPSIIWAGCFERYRIKHNKSYYSFYTEKWANKLSKVDFQ